MKVPVLVAAFILVVAGGISYIVLSQFVKIQGAQLRHNATIYLDRLSAAIAPYVARADREGTERALAATPQQYGSVRERYKVVLLPDGSYLASSSAPGVNLPPRLKEFLADASEDTTVIISDESDVAWAHRVLRRDGVEIGRILVELDIADLREFRREFLVTLILVDLGFSLLLALFGYLLIRRMLAPVALLTKHLEQAREGRIEPVPDQCLDTSNPEFRRLFERFNAMATAAAERHQLEARLAEQEKTSMLGRLASGMAHEVNNPLGGMLNAIDTLRRHGEDTTVRMAALSLLERGISGIRNVVRSALVTYKAPPDPSRLTRADLDDLQYLITPEIERRHLRLVWHNALPGVIPAPGYEIRQISLNLLLNACSASPREGTVGFRAEVTNGTLTITVRDQGPGLPDAVVRMLEDPASAGPLNGDLGIWIVAGLVQELKGRVDVGSPPPGGTDIRLSIPLSEQETPDAIR